MSVVQPTVTTPVPESGGAEPDREEGELSDAEMEASSASSKSSRKVFTGVPTGPRSQVPSRRRLNQSTKQQGKIYQ